MLNFRQQNFSRLVVDVFVRAVMAGQIILPRRRVTASVDFALNPKAAVLPRDVSLEVAR